MAVVWGTGSNVSVCSAGTERHYRGTLFHIQMASPHQRRLTRDEDQCLELEGEKGRRAERERGDSERELEVEKKGMKGKDTREVMGGIGERQRW